MKKIAEIAKQIFFCTVGSAVYAAAVSLFLDPNGIVPGGFTGIAMILGRFIPLPTGTLTLILNIPLLVAGIFIFGASFLATTVYSVAVSSVLMNVLMPFGPLTGDVLLSSLAGGALMAIGLAIVLRHRRHSKNPPKIFPIDFRGKVIYIDRRARGPLLDDRL